MAAEIHRLPDEGEQCIVVAWPLGEDGRKLHAGTALLGADGEALAVARQTWIQPRTGERVFPSRQSAAKIAAPTPPVQSE